MNAHTGNPNSTEVLKNKKTQKEEWNWKERIWVTARMEVRDKRTVTETLTKENFA